MYSNVLRLIIVTLREAAKRSYVLVARQLMPLSPPPKKNNFYCGFPKYNP